MLTEDFITPLTLTKFIANAAKTKRLSLNLSQKTLSERSGVSFATLNKFERTGKISLESLLKIALALGALKDFMNVFKVTPPEAFPTLDELLKQRTRQRGRR